MKSSSQDTDHDVVEPATDDKKTVRIDVEKQDVKKEKKRKIKPRAPCEKGVFNDPDGQNEFPWNCVYGGLKSKEVATWSRESCHDHSGGKPPDVDMESGKKHGSKDMDVKNNEFYFIDITALQIVKFVDKPKQLRKTN